MGQRCQIYNTLRGTISYVGQIQQIGIGYFVGLQLDLPLEMPNPYNLFEVKSAFGKLVFVRPDQIEVGDFPQIEEDD